MQLLNCPAENVQLKFINYVPEELHDYFFIEILLCDSASSLC